MTTGVSSGVVAASSRATGASFTAETSIDTVAGAEPAVPSEAR